MSDHRISRRSILSASAALTSTGTLGLPLKGLPREFQKTEAKNIIFCAVDGMAMSVLTMAHHLNQLRGGKGSYWAWLLDQDFVVNGLQDTPSLSSLVTDSAAAASAWGCGRRIWNAQINEFPDGTKLRTLYDLMQAKGMRTGLVTTTRITHATPSGFAIQIDHRDKENEIAVQHLQANVDVLMGGGSRHFDAAARSDKRNLFGEFANKGYRVVRDRDALLRAEAGKLLGLFSSSHIPYTVDRKHDAKLDATVPTLAEMTSKAIELLDGGPNGFILQVEGGRVDHAAHANDLPGMLYDQLEFEDAVRIAVEFALKDKETLVVITADHATGGPSLNGAGSEYFDSTQGLKSVTQMKASFERLAPAIASSKSTGEIKNVVNEMWGVELTDAEAGAIKASFSSDSPFKVSDFYKSRDASLAAILGNHCKVTWTSNNHTSDLVFLTAIGPGSALCSGLTLNTSLFDIMLRSKGLSHANPTMSFEEARRHRAKTETPETTHEDAFEEFLRESHAGEI